MTVEIEYVRRLVNAVIGQLGPGAPDWQIEVVGYLQIDNHTIDIEQTNTIRASLESPTSGYSTAYVDFSVGVPLPDATREVAGQIQDHAIEAAAGATIPACPGHKHPLTPRLVNGVPKWVCMQDGPDYYAKDVLPRFDPRYTLVDYMQDNPVRA